jgi:hypothetical protein
MSIIRFLQRRRALSQTLIGVFGLLAGASASTYVNLVTPWLSGTFADLGSSFTWIIAALVLVGAQIATIVIISGGNPKREAVREQVRSLLEVTTRALVHPHKLDHYPIRAHCRLADVKAKRLNSFCQWSYPVCNDSELPIEYDGTDRDVLVISKAFRNKMILAEDLPEDHHDRYAGTHRGRIWDELRCVLAAPIRDPGDANAAPVGTLSFDSSRPLSLVRFDSDEAKRLAELVAASIYSLLRDL